MGKIIKKSVEKITINKQKFSLGMKGEFKIEFANDSFGPYNYKFERTDCYFNDGLNDRGTKIFPLRNKSFNNTEIYLETDDIVIAVGERGSLMGGDKTFLDIINIKTEQKQRIFTDEVNLIYNSKDSIIINCKIDEVFKTFKLDFKTLLIQDETEEELQAFFKSVYNVREDKWYLLDFNIGDIDEKDEEKKYKNGYFELKEVSIKGKPEKFDRENFVVKNKNLVIDVWEESKNNIRNTKKLIKNINFRNSQNYILGNEMKTGIISEFLIYKSQKNIKDEKNIIFSIVIELLTDIFVSISNSIFYFLNHILKIPRYLSLFIVNILGLAMLIPFTLLLIPDSSGDAGDERMGIILLIIWYLLITYNVIKSNLGRGHYKIILFDRFGGNKFNYGFIDNNTLEGKYGETKSFYIESKKNTNFGEELGKYISFIGIFIGIFVFISIYFHGEHTNKKGIEELLIQNIESNKKIQFEKDIRSGLILTNYEKNILNKKLEQCYIKSIKNGESSFTCYKNKDLYRKEIIEDRINIPKEDLEKYITDTLLGIEIIGNDEILKNIEDYIIYNIRLKPDVILKPVE